MFVVRKVVTPWPQRAWLHSFAWRLGSRLYHHGETSQLWRSALGRNCGILDRKVSTTGRRDEERRFRRFFFVQSSNKPLGGFFSGFFFFENGVTQQRMKTSSTSDEHLKMMVNSFLLHLRICTLKLLACHTYRPLNESEDAQLK